MKKILIAPISFCPVLQRRTMFSNKALYCIFLVLVLLVCRQALGGQKYLVKTGKKSLEKHYLVETEDSDNDDSAQYGSVEGNMYIVNL